MTATDHLGEQFAGTYHVTDDPDVYEHEPEVEWLTTGDRSKPLRWARDAS